MALGRGDKKSKRSSRFVTIHKDPIGFGISVHYSIVRDNVTGVCYVSAIAAVGSTGGGVTMTPLLDAEGKPVIDHDSPEV